MSSDPATDLVERLCEPLTLGGDELGEAVALVLELPDPLFEPGGVAACRFGLARELGCEVRERVPVLLELRGGAGELGLEPRDDVRLAAPERGLWSGDGSRLTRR